MTLIILFVFLLKSGLIKYLMSVDLRIVTSNGKCVVLCSGQIPQCVRSEDYGVWLLVVLMSVVSMSISCWLRLDNCLVCVACGLRLQKALKAINAAFSVTRKIAVNRRETASLWRLVFKHLCLFSTVLKFLLWFILQISG